MSSMKILMLSNEFPPSIGGVQTHVYELAKALVRAGHRVAVVARRAEKSLSKFEIMDGIEVHRLKLPNSHLMYDWKLSRFLKKQVRENGFEVAHVHGMRPLKAAARAGVPVVFTNHTSSFLKRVKKGQKVLDKMRRELELASVVLAPSEELVEATRTTGYGGETVFISNGVDTGRFYPTDSALRKTLGIPASAMVFVLARRLVEKNGVLHFAKAIGRVQRDNFHVIVAGDGEDREQFEQIVADAGCSARVHMLGGVDNQKMPEVFAAGNVSVLPSLMEATSIAGLEAMACGLPLIGTRVGGIPVILHHEKTGLLVEPASPDALAQAMRYCCDNQEVVHTMGQAALDRARREFSWDKIAEQTLAYYR
ncbi:glycosyltransferase family 4 protein [Microbulbifer thermotolerans]|uniref:glycosyltransferase family 4 protein n=1 Tax=Microbulbifer thermotolerans TaxID=252514 RepID=UPI00224B715F|nr:glycosyltransferase family 4 protein [Microbulbifer thermotolerans]MCX2783389.1 glycosyltransferase family 4 protein [Microbulbifer thermotolerans]